ncbi:MAG TPA: TetR/AcrR family transcriptional regulator [Solirubrobacterales bacterium]
MHVSQDERRARSSAALLESAARGISRYGYGNLVLERVAAEAGYSRGAIYHQFAGKEELALAVVKWVSEGWLAEVAGPAQALADPLQALLALARGHAVYCRRDIARVLVSLRVEFGGRDHPVGAAVEAAYERLLVLCGDLIAAARHGGTIPGGPPPRTMALAFVGTVEGLVMQLYGHEPDDELLAERAVLGLLAVNPPPSA